MTITKDSGDHHQNCCDAVTIIAAKATETSCGEEKEKFFFEWIDPDIIVEILTRLPAASLARCRCVCRQWRDLACDQVVVHQHAERSSRRASSSPPRFISLEIDPVPDFVALDSDDEAEFIPRLVVRGETLTPIYEVSLETHWDRSNYWFHMSNSCNGLVCIYDVHPSSSITLLNPTTLEYTQLPEPENFGVKGSGFQTCFLGFHPETKEYKVLRISAEKNSSDIPQWCQVITLGIGTISSWRRTNDVGNLFSFGKVIVVKGKVFWLSSHLDCASKEYEMMTSFDLKHEAFEWILLPISDRPRIHRSSLVELDGKVCLAVPGLSEGGALDVWALKDGVKKIWKHKFSIDESGCPKPLLPSYQGKFLVNRSMSLGYYDLPNKKVSWMQFSQQNLREAFVHVETLVSGIGGQSLSWCRP